VHSLARLARSLIRPADAGLRLICQAEVVNPHRFAVAGVLLALSSPVSAQVAPCTAAETSTNLPPAGSPPLVRCLELVFHPDAAPLIDSRTYLFHISPLVQPSLRSERKWVPYKTGDALKAFSQLWRTGFLENLWIEVIDEPYENGVMGKHVIFHIEERQRVKGIELIGSTVVAVSKIEDALKRQRIHPDTGGFVSEEADLIRNVRRVILDLYAEQGYANATIDVRKVTIPGAMRLVRLTFDIKEGTKN
jgi:hypothetical protein